LRSLFPITRSALRLSSRERLDAVRAWLWLVAVRAGLVCLPYGSIARLVAGIPARRRLGAGSSQERYIRAIHRACRLVPACGCLPQAVAAQCLLRREGWSSQIVFGVAQGNDSGLEAHAWLWNDGRIVIGGEPAGRYTPLAAPRAS
jgi:Transglutaminase-like superfamily